MDVVVQLKLFPACNTITKNSICGRISHEYPSTQRKDSNETTFVLLCCSSIRRSWVPAACRFPDSSHKSILSAWQISILSHPLNSPCIDLFRTLNYRLNIHLAKGKTINYSISNSREFPSLNLLTGPATLCESYKLLCSSQQSLLEIVLQYRVS